MNSETTSETLPTDWEMETVAAIANGGLFVDGDWVESKDQDPTGTVRLTQLADVGEGEFRNRSDRWMRQDQADKVGVTYLAEGDLLIARMPDPLGRCCQVPKLDSPAVTVVDVAILRIDPQVAVNKFMMWALNSPAIRLAIEQLSSGTTRTRISRKNLGSVEIPLPSLREQEKIVEILEEQLSRLDAALASVYAVRKKSARFRRSLLHAAFTGALTGHDTSDGTLPTGWVKGTIGHVAGVVGGRTPTKFEQRLESSPTVNRSVPFYKVGDMNSAVRYLSESRVYFAESETGVFGIEILPSGTVIFPKAGGAIATNKKRILEVPGAIDLNCMGVTPNGELLPKLLYWFFESFNLSSIADGSVLPQIGKKKVAGIEICYPVNLVEQQKLLDDIEVSISKSDEADLIAEAIEKKSSALRRSLLHFAFTGNLTKEWREGAHV